DDALPIAIELHAAECAPLVEVSDRVGLDLGLFCKGMFAKLFRAAGRSIAEIDGAMIVPPRTLVVGGAIENLEVNIGMIEPDPAELHEVFRLQPDGKPSMI